MGLRKKGLECAKCQNFFPHKFSQYIYASVLYPKSSSSKSKNKEVRKMHRKQHCIIYSGERRAASRRTEKSCLEFLIDLRLFVAKRKNSDRLKKQPYKTRSKNRAFIHSFWAPRSYELISNTVFCTAYRTSVWAFSFIAVF